MKRITLLCVCIIMIITVCFAACRHEYVYTPAGEFYVKTSPAAGDAGVRDVISLEADHATYEGDGDITVSMTVGFGRLPEYAHYRDDATDTFYILYKIVEAPWAWEKEAVWEKKVEYAESFDNPKYNSTEQKNSSFLFIAFYGEFYPLYTERVDIVFPSSVKDGYLSVEIYDVIEGQNDYNFFSLQVGFERVDGVLRLDSSSLF